MAKMGNKGKFEKPKDTKGTIKRLYGYVKRYKLKFITIILLLLVAAVTDMASVLMMTPIIDDYVLPMVKNAGEAIYVQGLIKMLVIFMALIVVNIICLYVSSRIMIKIAQDTVYNMRSDLVAKIERLPIKYFDTHEHGSLMSRITNDMDSVSNTLNNSITQITNGVFTLITSLVAMFSISTVLSLIAICVIPVISIVVISISKYTKKQFMRQQECLANVNGYIEEYISGQKVIKAFCKEDKVLENFADRNNTLKKEGFKAQFTAGAVMPISAAINGIGTAIIMVTAGFMAVRGKISIGNIISFNTFSGHFGRPINEISNQFNTIQAGLAGAERMFAVLDEVEEFPAEENQIVLNNVKGEVEFKNVTFGYNENRKVIKNFSLKANPGETIALVGPTGAGKTTIINLLTRFYDVDEGEILVDGINIKNIDKNSLRNSLGMVLQDTVMFSEKVKDNIRYGKLDATDEEIIEAAKVSNAHHFIKRLKHSYDTMLAEDGSNISVGQRQLLNISRVAINDPEILILDEATSNVDTRTEVHVNKAMKALLKGRTSFVIAHRLSTIRDADKIVVINNGEIKEQGNHEELIAKKGAYYDLYMSMFNEPEIEE